MNIELQREWSIPVFSFRAISFRIARSSLDLSMTSSDTCCCEGPSEWTLIVTTARSAGRYKVDFPLMVSANGVVMVKENLY